METVDNSVIEKLGLVDAVAPGADLPEIDLPSVPNEKQLFSPELLDHMFKAQQLRERRVQLALESGSDLLDGEPLPTTADNAHDSLDDLDDFERNILGINDNDLDGTATALYNTQISMESFVEKLEHDDYQIQQLAGVQHELSFLAKGIREAGVIDKQTALSLESAYPGIITDHVSINSFTQHPSRTNLTLSLEEIDATQAKVAAVAGVAGLFVIYKILQWIVKSFTGNVDACKSIGGNIQNARERSRFLSSSPVEIAALDDAQKKALEDLLKNAAEKKDGQTTAEFLSLPENQKTVELALLNAAWNSNFSKLLSKFATEVLQNKVTDDFLNPIADGAIANLNKLENICAVIENLGNKEEFPASQEVFKALDWRFLDNALRHYNITDVKNTEHSSVRSQALMNAINREVEPSTEIKVPAPTVDANGEMVDIVIPVDAFSKIDDNVVKGAAKFGEWCKEYKKKVDEIKNDNVKKHRIDLLSEMSKQSRAVANVLSALLKMRNTAGKTSQALLNSFEQAIKAKSTIVK